MHAFAEFIALGIAVALAACSVDGRIFTSIDGPPAEDCNAAGDEDGNGLAGCADPACAGAPACLSVCGNGRLDPGERCDDGNTVSGDGCSADCRSTEICGNGITDLHEQCDDGNTQPGDGCSATCAFERCGNGILDPGEVCDVLPVDPTKCSVDCKSTLICGNGLIDPGEQCDLGGMNSNSGDCRIDCVLNRCGDGFVNTQGSPGHPEHIEACDDAPPATSFSRTVIPTETATCNVDCTTPQCGDAKVNRHFTPPGTTHPEVCDDGPGANNDNADCTAICQPNVCGDGHQDTTGINQEACDDGDRVDNNGCTNACQLAACGDGIRGPNEQCDDGPGNNGPGLGCNATCQLNVCGDGDTLLEVEQCDGGVGGFQQDTSTCDTDCTFAVCGDGHLNVTAGEQCDHGASNGKLGDPCSATCHPVSCGNGDVEQGEQCDDGNAIDGDGCETDCTLPRCGNGIKDSREQCDDGNAVDGDGCETDCTLPRCGNGIKDGGEQCDDGNTTNSDGCENSCVISVFAYIKASNAGAGDGFGGSIALSADGSTLAVGAPSEASSAVGINSDQANNAALGSGAVYVFTRNGTTWSQQAYIKASNTASGDNFGQSVALSADGSTLAVGAAFEDSGATGINGNQADESKSNSGAVYVFTRSGTTWSQEAYVKASNTDLNDRFGQNVALSADGATLAVSTIGEDSSATGINSNQADNSAIDAGAAYVFARSGTTWSQQAYVKASNTGGNDQFGQSLALSADGSVLAVGAVGEDSSATGIGNNQGDNLALQSGAAYVFTRSGATWSQQAYVKASNTGGSDNFGQSVTLSADGSTLAVGALGEDSNAIGINGNQGDNSLLNAGAVYVFTRIGTTWSQQAYVKASNTGAGDQFGFSIALSASGSALAVGAFLEDSNATGINSDQADNSALDAGAVYVFTRTGTTWGQQTYIKAPNTNGDDRFGRSVALATEGTLAVSSLLEDSAATGIGGNQSDDPASDFNAGAVYVHQ